MEAATSGATWPHANTLLTGGFTMGKNMDKERVITGIAAYQHEQAVLIRLLSKRGRFTESEFDTWFRGREWRRPLRFVPVTGGTFILGLGSNGGNKWAEMLELLQIMVELEIVDAEVENGLVVYSLHKHKRN